MIRYPSVSKLCGRVLSIFKVPSLHCVANGNHHGNQTFVKTQIYWYNKFMGEHDMRNSLLITVYRMDSQHLIWPGQRAMQKCARSC